MINITCKWDDEKYFDLTKRTGVYTAPDGKKIRLLHASGNVDVEEIINVNEMKIGIKPITSHNNAFTHVGFFC